MSQEAMFSEEAKTVFEMSPRQRAAEIGAVVKNEQITRHRVNLIEGVLSRGLWGRLTWLLRGK